MRNQWQARLASAPVTILSAPQKLKMRIHAFGSQFQEKARRNSAWRTILFLGIRSTRSSQELSTRTVFGSCDMATQSSNGNGTVGPLVSLNGSQSVVAAGLRLLLHAHDYANQTDTDLWQFALETEELRRVGMTNNEFRWLLVKGYAKQAQELTLPGDDTRSFRLLGRFALFPDSCFMLTDAGVRVARESCLFESRHSASTKHSIGLNRISATRPTASTGRGETDHLKPTWDSERKELRLGGAVVKVFKWPASNQEVILDVFEEEGWPARIDDPLPFTVEKESKRRLHDTIKCLNRSQKNSLIHFRGDGTGEGVIWEFTHDCLRQSAFGNGAHQLVGSNKSA